MCQQSSLAAPVQAGRKQASARTGPDDVKSGGPQPALGTTG